MKSVRVLVLGGYGINCDVETGWAFEMAGADTVETVHINRVIEGAVSMDDYGIVVFPGGFSFGDHISSGRVLGIKIKMELGEKLAKFIADKKLVLGICNGFQVMVKMGLLPGGKISHAFNDQSVTLVHNDSNRYEDRWVTITKEVSNKSPFLKNIAVLPIAVRHGEGKFMANSEEINRLEKSGMVAFRYTTTDGNPTQEYPANPNGSINAIAAITNQAGTVLGMMPHPEVYISKTQHPHWTRENDLPEEGMGLQLFRNAVDYIKHL